jgi:hypothetical protein
MITLILDKDGKIARPMRREGIWRIGAITPHLGDKGRLEYYRVLAWEDTNLPLRINS